MKKRMTSLLLALLLMLSLGVPAFAAQEGALTGGSITIDNAVPEQSYSIYQLLYIESYNADTGAYAYKANSAWESWLKQQQDTYLTFSADGYVTWVKDADVAAFAKLAQAYAAENTAITADGTQNAPAAETDKTTSTVSFTDLKLGYYLVDTSLGTICSLDTTNPSVTMREKNVAPTVEKEVKEDTNQQFGPSNTAQIGDTVEFKTTVHAKPGAKGYTLHDQMAEGLTLLPDSITVKAGDTTLTKGTDYTVAFNVDHKEGNVTKSTCDFEITFTQTYLNGLTKVTDIVVFYNAVLNNVAKISTDSNKNDTWLVYGDNATSTTIAHTETTTYSFQLVKTDKDNKLLTGAKFELYDAQKDGNKIALVKVQDGVYRIATAAEQTEGFTSAVIEGANVTVQGLDANTTYWLEETEAPAGYNKLSGRVAVAIETSNLSAVVTDSTWTSGGVHVVNQTGTELPSTGGMGTTVLYVVGAALVLAAAVLLVVKKRTNA